jgi:thiol-disulfide isomerase/thioredoxin
MVRPGVLRIIDGVENMMGKRSLHFYCRIGFALAVFLLAPVSVFAAPIKDPDPTLRSGDLLPDISLSSPASQAEREYFGVGEKKMFSVEEVQADLIVIKYLNSNCGYCIKLLPIFDEIYRTVDQDADLRKRIKILGISVGDTSIEVDFLKKNHAIPYPVIPDTEFEAHYAMGTRRIPFIVIARKDRQGKWVVASVHVGLIFSAESFVGELKSILAIDPETLRLKKPAQ